MDNNYAEQAIRPFTIARKNFVLMESDNGAKASAMIFSIAETAKANVLNTYEYFNLLLSEIPKHQDDKDTKYLDALLPWSKMSKTNAQADLKSLKFSMCIYMYPNPCNNAGIFDIRYSWMKTYPASLYKLLPPAEARRILKS